MLVHVKVVHPIAPLVQPVDADVAGLEQFAQLVADEIDDFPEVQLGGEPALDGVDDPVKPMVVICFSLAVINARIIFSEFPDVEIPISTSPGLPNTST